MSGLDWRLSAATMFDPSFPQCRRVDLSGSRLEDRPSLLARARQEREQRHRQQLQQSAASRIQRWYRSHQQRRQCRAVLRGRYDSEWAQYRQRLAVAGAAGQRDDDDDDDDDRQAMLGRLVRLLWLSFDQAVDGLRLLSLAAGVVKSSDSSPGSPLSFLHAAAAPSSRLFPSRPPRPRRLASPAWPLQASHLCVLCLSKLAAAESAAMSASTADRRVCSLLIAAVSLLLDHSKWKSQTLSSPEEQTGSTAQHAELLRCLCSPSSCFFPVLHRALLRLCQPESDSEKPQSASVTALLSAVLKAFAASSPTDSNDAFALHVVAHVLTVPGIASSLTAPALLPLCSPPLLSRIVNAALRIATAAEAAPSSVWLPQLAASDSCIPSLSLLLGNVVQLLNASLDWKRAELRLLLPLLRLLPLLLQSVPRQLFSSEEEERRTAWRSAAPDARSPAPVIRLPAMSMAAVEPVSAAEQERRREAVVRQLRPLQSVSFFTSLLQRAFIVPAGQREEDESLHRLLTSFSLSSSASSAGSEALMPAFASFLHCSPEYMPRFSQLLTLLVSLSPQARSSLSSLTFSSPLLPALWRCLEVRIGCRLTAYHPPPHANADELKTAAASSSSASSALLSLLSAARPSRPVASSPAADAARAARLRWEQAILASHSGQCEEAQQLGAIFLLFLQAFLPVLFILEDDELLSQHPPFPDLQSLRAFTQLLKLITFRLVWEGEGGGGGEEDAWLASYSSVCRLILLELYQRDIRMDGSGAELEEDEERRVERAGQAWLIDAADGGGDWTAAWSSWLHRSEPLDLTEKEEEAAHCGALASSSTSSASSLHLRILRVLRTLPFITPFRDRVLLFRRLLGQHRAAHNSGPVTEIRVRRSALVSDGLFAVNYPGPFRIRFVDDETGETEAGLDMAGLMKELLESLLRELLSLDYGLFMQTSSHTFCPNPHAPELLSDASAVLHSVGRLIGRCIAEGILLQVELANVLLLRMIGQGRVMADLRELDAALYSSLMRIKHHDGDVAELCLTFAVDEEFAGIRRLVELEEGGAGRAVTNSSRILYLYRTADYYLNRRLRPVVLPFLSGLGAVLPMSALRLFNLSEVRLLLSGSRQPLDVDDWLTHTVYDGCSSDSRPVLAFWQCVREMTEAERRRLLQFVTSLSRAPYSGFAALQPRFTLRLVSAGDGNSEATLTTAVLGFLGRRRGTGALPTASTCFNLLKLPQYASRSIMKDKLLTAISAKGFHLL